MENCDGPRSRGLSSADFSSPTFAWTAYRSGVCLAGARQTRRDGRGRYFRSATGVGTLTADALLRFVRLAPRDPASLPSLAFMSQSGDPKAKRLLKMLFLLQSGRRYDIARLAREMEVSRRTIFRDVATLKSVGVPVRYDEESHALVIARSAADGLRSLAYDDLALLLLGALASARAELPDAGDRLDQALRKLVDGLESDLRERVTGLIERVIVQAHDPLPPTPRSEVVVAVAKAITYERRVHLVVDDESRNVEWRFRFAPFQLRVRSGGWSALGASELHPRLCLIDLAHVQRASVTDEKYVLPETIPADDEFERL